jgi:GT2 family glycosyltransferase
MAYAIVDAELSEPLPCATLGPDEDGIALLLRSGGRPVYYGLHPLEPGVRLDGDALLALAGPELRVALAAQELRETLAPPPPPRPADVTAVVCTRDRATLLSTCLRSLRALGDAAPPVLVVDNDPPDGATEALAAQEGVRYVREPLAGLDFARNRGLREAESEYVAFIDDDTVVDRGWRAGLDEALAEHPDAGAVTGLVLPAELRTEAQIVFELRGGFRRGLRKLRYAGRRMPGNPLYPVGAGIFGAGCNMVLRRELVLGLGGFDEALDTGPPLPGGGDLDVFHRVLVAGSPLVYEPRMLVFHRHRPEHEALRRQYWSWGDGFVAFLEKTYRADRTMRPKIRAMLLWWLGYAARNVVGTALGRRPGSLDLPLAELGGGLAGLTGSYARSVRRSEANRKRHG